MPFDPKEVKAGDILSATLLRDFFREVVRLGKFQVVAPIEMQNDEAGIRFSLGLYMPVWIKLTSALGSGGKYAWTEQIAAVGGTWSDHPSGRTGTTAIDPAYETSGYDGVPLSPNPVVRAWRDPATKNLLFQAGTC